MALRLSRQHFYRLIVEHIAAVVDQAVLAMGGVGVERNVCHDAEFGEILFQFGNDARDEAVRVVGFTRIQAF